MSTEDEGRIGGRLLTIPWSELPWWGVILAIVGLIVGWSVLSSEAYLDAIAFIAEGVLLTLRVTVVSYVIALVIGLLFGLMRVSKNPVLYAISTLYVEVMRGIPLLVIILYSGLVITPWVRDVTNQAIDLRGVPAAVLGLAVGFGAYLTEIYRGGIQSIERGQMEAARSLGMSYLQAMRHVILPQAIRRILPPLGNEFIAMLKDSSLIAVIALPDILQRGRLYISRTFRAFEGFNTVALMYLVLTICLSFIVRLIERKTTIE